MISSITIVLFLLATSDTETSSKTTPGSRALQREIASGRNCKSKNAVSPGDGSDLMLSSCTFKGREYTVELNLPTKGMSGSFRLVGMEKVKPEYPALVLSFGSTDRTLSCYAQFTEFKGDKSAPQLAMAYVDNRTGQVYAWGEQPECRR